MLYIDEAGDDALDKIAAIDGRGASEWLVLSGILLRKQYEPHVDHWISDIRLQVGQVQGHSLHFRNMSPHNRAKSCSLLSTLPIRCFTVASNKKNMRQYSNPRAEVQGNPEWFYNFCSRILLERVTELCFQDSNKNFHKIQKLKVIFSERGAHSYSQTAAYFEKLIYQARSQSTFLKTREIRFETLDRRLIQFQPHDTNGGLQLADIAASAFYQSLDTSNIRNWKTSNAISLMPIMATNKGVVSNQGLVLLPSSDANLNNLQKQIFNYYGYEIP
ncbi:DUF3800 domain-containing protein [Asticcacaulis taihuensis]|uniref:DUF3800 domain-containing protein n=1 Tax=Asticcacaulis taihuensis TaxID=260084 RepID=UPI0026EDC012|nr:DUF3800 domain-containing protein [Asticcacaulis taihuensis]